MRHLKERRQQLGGYLPQRITSPNQITLPDIASHAKFALDADGKEMGLPAFAGQGLVINLWATWCPPCVAEMPALDRLQAMVRAERIAVLALSSDRGGRAQVEPFYQRLGLKELAIWLDPRGAAARALGARGLPTTVIIDRAGREVARLEGEAAWDAPELVAAVRRLVGAP
jgi:thiol-disulfide isomerase/thioredoxin